MRVLSQWRALGWRLIIPAFSILAVGSALVVNNNLAVRPGPVKVTLVTDNGPFAKLRLGTATYSPTPFTGQIVFASTDLDELETEVATSGAFANCVYGAAGKCWPAVKPAHSLLVAAPFWPADHCLPLIRPSSTGELVGHKLVLTIDPGPDGACTPGGGGSRFAMFAVGLGALPAGEMAVEVHYVERYWQTNQILLVLAVSTTVDVPWHLDCCQ